MTLIPTNTDIHHKMLTIPTKLIKIHSLASWCFSVVPVKYASLIIRVPTRTTPIGAKNQITRNIMNPIIPKGIHTIDIIKRILTIGNTHTIAHPNNNELVRWCLMVCDTCCK
jgi:hypothetical protein